MAKKTNSITATIISVIVADAKRGVVHLITRDSTGRLGAATRVKGKTTFRKSRMSKAAINEMVGHTAV